MDERDWLQRVSGRAGRLFVVLLVLVFGPFLIGLAGEVMIDVGRWFIHFDNWWNQWTVNGLRVRPIVVISLVGLYAAFWAVLLLDTFVLDPIRRRRARKGA